MQKKTEKKDERNVSYVLEFMLTLAKMQKKKKTTVLWCEKVQNLHFNPKRHSIKDMVVFLHEHNENSDQTR